MKTAYFDNAATSWPKPPGMIEAMVSFDDSIGANPGRSGHRLSVDAGRVVHEARDAVADLIGSPDPLNVVFTKNATEALNIAIMGLLSPGDHVITSGMEHNSVMRPLRYLERNGVALSMIPCSGDGSLNVNEARKMIRSYTKLIVVTHASNVTGTILPIDELATIAHSCGAIIAVDASQTAGCVPIDVIRSGIDILCFTGHKSLLGPQGTGGLYIREGLADTIRPLMRGGTGSCSEFEEQPEFMPDRFESGTPNAIGLAGLAAGVRYVAETGVDRIRDHEMELVRRFYNGAVSIKGVTIFGCTDLTRRTAILSFSIDGMNASEVAFDLDERFGIMARPGLHCAPAAHRCIGTFPGGAVRFSFGMFTTKDEIDHGLEAIDILSAEARK